MPEPIYVLMTFAMYLAGAVSLAMTIRALLSWFDIGEDSKFMRLIYGLTEPAIIPLRKLFYKMNWFQELPIDMSFTFTWLILTVIEIILQSMLY